jgi:DNA-binding response OmpR family regulator
LRLVERLSGPRVPEVCPDVTAEPGSPSPRPRREEDDMERQPKILVVDDDADFVNLLKTVLATKQYEVITAYSGEEGMQKASEEKPDLIILDVIMPLKNGFTVCDELKRNAETASIPVFMLTGFRERGGETSVATSQGLYMEAEDYMEKPVNATELLERVERRLNKMGF